MLGTWIVVTSSTSIDCNTFESCANQTLTTTDGLNCFGAASCINSPHITVRQNGGVSSQCSGTRACQNAQMYTSDADDQDINGFLAMGWTKLVNMSNMPNSDHEFECDAEASCYSIDSIIIDDHIDCWSFRSCDSIRNITVINTILNTHAMQALQNSKIYSRNTITVNLMGFFAGYNASIYCNADSTCNVNCNENSCENLNYFCDDNANSCSVDCIDNNGTVCPNGWKNGIFTNNSMVIGDYNEYMSNINNNKKNSVTYSFWQRMNELFDDEFVTDYNFDYSYDFDQCDIKCDGYETCYQNLLNLSNNNATLCCDGRDGCKQATLHFDLYSYTSSNDGKSNYTVNCNADYSCLRININKHNTRNDNNNNNYNYSSTINIFCRGFESCEYMNIAAISGLASTSTGSYRTDYIIDKIICSGSRACENSIISQVSKIACLSYRSCASSDLWNIRYIFSGGHEAVQSSRIYTNGTDLNFYLFGFNYPDSDQTFTIYCQFNDVCNIYCYTVHSCDKNDWILDCNIDATCNFIYLSSSNAFDWTSTTFAPLTSLTTLATLTQTNEYPSLATTMHTTTTSKSNEQHLTAQTENLELFAIVLTTCIMIFFVFIGIFGYIDAKCIRRNEIFSIGAIKSVATETIDFVSGMYKVQVSIVFSFHCFISTHIACADPILYYNYKYDTIRLSLRGSNIFGP